MTAGRLLVTCALCAGGATVARAEPGDVVGAVRPPPGAGAVAVVDQRSLTAGQVGAAWSLAIDATIGVTPSLALGVSHSGAALGLPRDGGGLCIDSAAHDCASLYAGGFVDARWRAPGARSVTVLVRLGVAGRDPWKPAVRLGAIARGRRDAMWWAVQPEVAVALASRGNGNRDALHVPAWFGVAAGPVQAWAESGVHGDVDGFGDGYAVPLGVGVAGARRGVTLAVTAGFPQLFGQRGSTRIRAGTWWARYRW